MLPARGQSKKGRNSVVLAVLGGLWVMTVLPKRRLSTGQSRAAEVLPVLRDEPSCSPGASLALLPGV